MLKNTLLIINPVARTGRVMRSVAHIRQTIDSIIQKENDELQNCAVREAPGHLVVRQTTPSCGAYAICKEEASAYNTVIVVGGDGVINEAVNGLMTIDAAERPRLGIIPCGNGDDFARSIGMKRKPEAALKQYLEGLHAKQIDLGCANGRYFHETLSIGIDAAIAIGTFELRQKTGRTGTSLYVQSGLKEISSGRLIRHVSAKLSTGATLDLDCYLLAIQNGPTYGGGFCICPTARPDDGILDLCWISAPLSALTGIRLLSLVKNGKHAGHKNVHFARAKSLDITLEKDCPIQIDGEILEADNLHIELVPNAISVLAPR